MRRPRYARRRSTASGLFFLLIGYLLAATPAPDVRFTDITQTIKIDFKHESSATSNKYLVETMGGGVALLDYDNDGRLDIFFTNGAKIDDPMPDDRPPDKSDRKYWNRLYHQNSDGTFTDVTEKAGLTGMPQNHYEMGIAVGDYDNDGFEDIYVTGYGGNTLYHNNGNGTFTDVTKKAGVGGGGMECQRRVFRLRQRRQARPLRHSLRELDIQDQPLLRRKTTRLSRLLPSRQLRRHHQHPLSQQR